MENGLDQTHRQGKSPGTAQIAAWSVKFGLNPDCSPAEVLRIGYLAPVHLGQSPVR